MTLAEENRALKERLQSLETRLNRPQSGEEMNELSAAFARADAVAGMFGQRALQALPGETPLQYRQRLARGFQKHSVRFAKADLARLDSATLAPIEEAIYADAAATANDSASYAPGELRAIKFRDEAGRECTRWVGDNMGWMQMFMSQGRRGKILDPRNRNE